MTTVGPAGDVGHVPHRPDAPAHARRGPLARALAHPALVAAVAWLVAAPLAAAVPVWTGADPFRQQDADLPLALGGIVLAAVAAVALRRREPWVTGLAAGLFAAFTVLLMRTALHGTPFAFEGAWSDTGRISAMATRYTTTWSSSDGIVAGVPSEYPPLFPYLVGKAAVLLDEPAWRLLAPAEIIVTSGAVVAGFALWHRLVAAPVALAAIVLVFAVFPAPSKSYEVLALAVVLPWLLSTVGRPERGALGWLPAGLIGAVTFQIYFGFLLYAAPGILVLAWTVRRDAADRTAYVLHLAKTAAVVLVLSSWFLVPYAVAMAGGGKQVADMWDAPQSSESPFPFLQPTPLGVVQLAGLAAMVWYRRSAWWASPLLTLLLGVYAYRVVNMARWGFTGHTGLYYYTTPLISALLVVAAVLGAAEAAPRVAERAARPVPPGTGVAVVAALTAMAGFVCWSSWMPASRWIPKDDNVAVPDPASGGWLNRQTVQAHAQRLPGGGRPRYAAEAAEAGVHSEMIPVERIRAAAERIRGAGAAPATVSFDEQLFALLPWRGYISAMRTASAATARFDDRLAELRRVASYGDPARFAEESARTRFGAIDVFVLRREGTGLTFRPLQVKEPVRFSRAQFDPAAWKILDGLRHGGFVAIRR
ncbi:arabinofuranosyltransferase [Actinomadura roseirufa]|uniref:arabinofuranosyltransferase n=1 Tax=Actinomadura roseirufa TaxID=2094049 RepID=UPI0013F15D79|nr:arabinofuranosyltransferase [Actinomadura roseirufa]